MYHTTVLQRPQEEEEQRLRRENMTGSKPPYTSHSPTLPQYGPPFSPTNGSHQRHFNNQYHPPTQAPPSIQASSQNSHSGPPRSPTTNGLLPHKGSAYPPRDKPTTSTYYDPTSDQGAPNSNWNYSQYSRQSPIQTQQVSSFRFIRVMCRRSNFCHGDKMSRPLTLKFSFVTESGFLHLPGFYCGTKFLQ
jgi:hypothetical protein